MRQVLSLAVATTVIAGLFAAISRAEDPKEGAKAMLEHKLSEVRLDGHELAAVFDFLRDVTGESFFINWHRLEAAGIKQDTKISLQASNITLVAFLDDLCKRLSSAKGTVCHRIGDGVIEISTTRDPRQPVPRHAVLPKRLDRPLPEVNFNSQGLEDVLDFLRDVSGLKFKIDWTALAEAGVKKDAPVRVYLKNSRISTALRYILEDVEGTRPLQFDFEDGTVTFTVLPVKEPAKK